MRIFAWKINSFQTIQDFSTLKKNGNNMGRWKNIFTKRYPNFTHEK